MPILYNSKICCTKNKIVPVFKRGITSIDDLLNLFGQMESREVIITKWGITCNFLIYEQLRFRFHNFMRNHKDGTMFEQPCLPFLIQISNIL